MTFLRQFVFIRTFWWYRLECTQLSNFGDLNGKAWKRLMNEIRWSNREIKKCSAERLFNIPDALGTVSISRKKPFWFLRIKWSDLIARYVHNVWLGSMPVSFNDRNIRQEYYYRLEEIWKRMTCSQVELERRSRVMKRSVPPPLIEHF